MNLPLFQPFFNEWITFAIFFIGILGLVGSAEFALSKLNWNPEAARKFVHVLVGLLVAACPFIFKSNLPPMALAGIFIVVNALSLRSDKLKGMHTTERITYGTVYFPISFLVLAAFFWEKPITLILSMLVMAIADTIAGIVGQRAERPRKFTIWKDEKSLEGSTAMFLATMLIIYVGTEIFTWLFGAAFFLPIGVLIGLSGFVAMMATLAEAAAHRGSDNLSVPLITALTYELTLINYTHGTLLAFMIWTIGSAMFFLLAYRLKSLSESGAVGAFLMGVLVFGSAEIEGVIPLLTFFVLSSILSKIGKGKESGHHKGSRRDMLQVLANGGAGTLILLSHFFYPFEGAYLLFLGAIAAAAADTWATEIGYFSPNKPKHIVTFKAVEKGTSGGVTLLGLLGSGLGAGAIALIGGLVNRELFNEWFVVAGVWVVIAGVGGSLVDSILGGTVQAIFNCNSCGKETEKRTHCGVPARHVRGLKFIDNDMVNFLNTISGALIMYFLFILM